MKSNTLAIRNPPRSCSRLILSCIAKAEINPATRRIGNLDISCLPIFRKVWDFVRQGLFTLLLMIPFFVSFICLDNLLNELVPYHISFREIYNFNPSDIFSIPSAL
jgi:hypothetical protein